MRSFEEIMEDLTREIRESDLDRLESLASELEAIGDEQSQANALNARAMVTRRKGDTATALDLYAQALDLFERIGDRRGIGRILNNIAALHQAEGQYPAAFEAGKKALAVFTEIGDHRGVAHVTGNLGAINQLTGDFAKALEHFQRALDMAQRVGDLPNTIRMHAQIGTLHILAGDYLEALSYFERALDVGADSNERRFIANVHNVMGVIYSQNGSYQEAEEYFDRAINAYEALNDVQSIGMVTSNIAILYRRKGLYDQALFYHDRAMEIFKKTTNPDKMVSAMVAHGRTLVEAGRYDEIRHLLREIIDVPIQQPLNRIERAMVHASMLTHDGDLNAARKLYEEALCDAQEHGMRPEEADLHMYLRDLAQKENDFAAYIEHNNAYTRITEEIKGKEVAQKLALRSKEKEIQAEREERKREQAVLYSTLPKHVADRVIRGDDVSGDHFDNATVLFLDIAGFTTISDRIPPGHVVFLLKAIFRICDDICEEYGLTKIKTIGDSYMAVAGVPEPLDDHAQRAAHAAIDMLRGLNELELTMDPALGDTSWTQDVGEISVRIGLHSGPLVAGIVGDKQLQYDVWGDTVNVASRMESTGEPGRIQVSSAFADQLLLLRSVAEKEGTANSNSQQQLTERGTIDVKGKGSMTTYWLEG